MRLQSLSRSKTLTIEKHNQVGKTVRETLKLKMSLTSLKRISMARVETELSILKTD